LASGSGGDAEGERDDLRGGTSFGGTGGGDDITAHLEMSMDWRARVNRVDGIEARACCDGFDRRVPKFRVVMHAYVDISQNGRYVVN
jgi:hypothetical protein